MFSFTLQTARGISNSAICTVYFSDNFNSVFNLKSRETFLCLCSIACKKRRTDWILRILFLNSKNPSYLSLILTLQFFDGQSRQVGT